MISRFDERLYQLTPKQVLRAALHVRFQPVECAKRYGQQIVAFWKIHIPQCNHPLYIPRYYA